MAFVVALAGAAALWLTNGDIGLGIVGGAIGLALGLGTKTALQVRPRRSDKA
jgi:hypothetical protein